MHLIEVLYYLGLTAKKYYSLHHQKRLTSRVISIGNLTTGGTGKTPSAIAIAQEAKKRGLRPVILTRGYKGSAKGPCFVTKGDAPLLTAGEAGDEPFLMASGLKGVPIIKGGNRYESAMLACQELSGPSAPDERPLLFILDDGFQHWGLYRDKDIVLIDAGDPFGNGMLLPFGRLREPLRALGRADVIVLSKYAEPKAQININCDNILAEIKQYNPDAPVFFASHKPVSCGFLSGEKKPVNWLEGKKIFGACALGRPDSFRKTIVSLGAELVGFKAFRDHYNYTRKDIGRIMAEADASGADWIALTEKDIIKLGDFNLPDNILIIEVEFSVSDGFYESVFSK